MPIRAENRARYPADWRAISAAVRLDAGNRCEGSPTYPACRAENGKPHPVTGSKVVLTVAHLDHQPFDLRLPNVKGNCWLGNCDGCFLKSEANIGALTREFPDRAAWWEDMETLVASLTTGSGGRFSKRYSRAQLRDFVERHGDLALSTEGLLCQANDGDCT